MIPAGNIRVLAGVILILLLLYMILRNRSERVSRRRDERRTGLRRKR